MNRRWRSWIPGIVFWTLFLVSLGLGKRYMWLDTVWYAAWMLFLFVVAVYAVVQIFRHRHETGGYAGYRGVPRWVVTLFGDDVEQQGKPSIARKVDSK
jgi:hypothetical protein